MVDIINALRLEHENCRHLIGFMRARFNQLRNRTTSDCEWLLDAALLIKRYHNAVHQPVEDLFLEKLLARTGRARGLLKPLLHGDRRVFAAHNEAFIDALGSAISGDVIARDTLVALGEKTISDLDRQIVFEEHAIFPFGRQLLSGEDWLDIGGQIGKLHDVPLERRLLHEYASLKERAALFMH